MKSHTRALEILTTRGQYYMEYVFKPLNYSCVTADRRRDAEIISCFVDF